MTVLLLGEQGSGKGTLGRELSNTLGALFLSGGDLLRAEARKDTARGREVAERLAAFEGVDIEISYGVLEDALRANSGPTPLLLDGYPRVADQIERLVGLLGGPPDCALVLHVP